MTFRVVLFVSCCHSGGGCVLFFSRRSILACSLPYDLQYSLINATDYCAVRKPPASPPVPGFFFGTYSVSENLNYGPLSCSMPLVLGQSFIVGSSFSSVSFSKSVFENFGTQAVRCMFLISLLSSLSLSFLFLIFCL